VVDLVLVFTVVCVLMAREGRGSGWGKLNGRPPAPNPASQVNAAGPAPFSGGQAPTQPTNHGLDGGGGAIASCQSLPLRPLRWCCLPACSCVCMVSGQVSHGASAVA
jgi:hypothetical protein